MSNSKINLSENQEKIASHKDGALLVMASIGSGKTRALTERIKRLVKLTKREILVITFTSRASYEIKERLQADPNINDQLFIGTFHDFCMSVLKSHGSAIGYDKTTQIFSKMEDRLDIIGTAFLLTPSFAKYFHASDIEQTQMKLKGLEAIAKIKRDVISDEELDDLTINKKNIIADQDALDLDTVIPLYRGYEYSLASMNAIDLDDLLLLSRKLFINHPKIAALYRRSFPYICVDDAQDMNKAQYMLVRALTGDEHKNVMLVGGSDTQYMTKSFIDDYSPTIISLNENYRSAKKTLKLANQIIPNPSSPSPTNLVVEGICEIFEFVSVEEETNWIVSKIKNLLSVTDLIGIEGEAVDQSRIEVLARNKSVLSSVEKGLNEAGYKTYYKSSSYEVVFDSDFMKFFNLALLVQVNPRDRLHLAQLQRMVYTVRKSITKAGMSHEAISELKSIVADIKSMVENMKFTMTLNELKDKMSSERFPIFEVFRDAIDAIIQIENDGSNFEQTITQLLEKIENKDHYVNIDNNEKILMSNDLNELLKYWQRYSANTTNISISSFRNAMTLGNTYQKVEKDGIALSTVHTMKGQESDIVFLVGMDDETFPDYRALAKGGIEMEQERNNLYVAITRAKRYLYITYPTSRIMPWGDVKIRKRSSLLPQVEL